MKRSQYMEHNICMCLHVEHVMLRDHKVAPHGLVSCQIGKLKYLANLSKMSEL